MQNDPHTSDPLSHSDDAHVLRYLLHTIRGISPVSGGAMGDMLEYEYAAEEPTSTDF